MDGADTSHELFNSVGYMISKKWYTDKAKRFIED